MAQLIGYIRETTERISLEHGLSENEARAVGREVMELVQARYGGSAEYVGGSDIGERNRLIRKLNRGVNRDALCSQFGISRRTFYRIIGGKS